MLKSFIRVMEFWKGGYANGYVVLPKEHKYYGVSYDDIGVDVHGGLTFSEEITPELIKSFNDIPIRGNRMKFLDKSDIGKWLVGFDTAHCNDNLDNWNKEACEKEIKRLREQLEMVV